MLCSTQLISYGILSDPIKEYVLKIDKVSSLEIQNLIKKYLASPFLSITGDKNLCNEIKNRWIEDF